MKFFHISDIHLGLKLNNRDLYEDQKYILQKIAETAKKHEPDVILIAGDVYDKSMPSADAISLFDNFITDLKNALKNVYILIISGNHDSPERLNLYRNILSNEKLFLVGVPPMKEDEFIEKVTLKDEYGEINFYLLPFVKPAMIRKIFSEEKLTYNDAVRKLILRENIDTTKRNIIVSHQFYLPAGKNAADIERSDTEIRTVGNIDEVKADILYDFDYAALGHLHKAMTVGKECVRYAGTPLQCSVNEAGQEKGILLVDIKEKGNITIEKIPLIPLRKIRKVEGRLEDILENSCEDYVNITVIDDELNSDAMNRIRAAFPFLLSVNKKTQNIDFEDKIIVTEDKNEIELIKEFLGDIDEAEEKILTDTLEEILQETEEV